MNYSIVMFIGVVGEDIGGHIRTGMTITDEAIDNSDPAELGRVFLDQMKEARGQIAEYKENQKNAGEKEKE